MNLRWMWLWNVRGLAQRWSRTALSVAAVGAGVSLVIGCVIAQHSLNRSIGDFGDQLTGGAPLRVEGPADHGSLDASVVPVVASTPGVKAAVPLVFTIVEVTDSRGRASLVPALGVDCGVQAIVGSFDCDPSAMAEMGDAPLLAPNLARRLGPDGHLHTNLTSFRTRESFTVEQLNRINGGQVAVFSLAASQRQFVRPGAVDQVLVVPQSGTNLDALRIRLEQAVGDHNKVVLGSEPVETSVVAMLILPFLFVISLIGLVIGAQLVRNALDLSLEERRRALATTAALGATPRLITIGLLLEGGVAGLLGGLIAVIGGRLVAGVFVGGLSNELAKATGLTIDVVTPSSAVGLALGLATIVSLLASIPPARRAAKLDLVAELSGRRPFEAVHTGSNRTLAALGILAVAVLGLGYAGHRNGALSSWQPLATIAALVLSALVGYAACAQLTPRLLASLKRAPGFGTGPARVAVDNITSARRRTVAVAIAVTAPVFVATIFGGIEVGLRDAAKQFVADSPDTVSASTLELNNTSGVDSKVTPDMEAELRAFPGVARIEHMYFLSINHPAMGTGPAVAGGEGDPPDYQVFAGVGGKEAFARGEVMIGPALARSRHLRPGDTLRLPGRFGWREYSVGGIWASPESVGYSVTMTAAQLLELAGPRPSGPLSLVAAPGVSTEDLAHALRAAGIDARLRVQSPADIAKTSGEEFASISAPFKGLQYAMLVVALVATTSTLLLAAVQRRRDKAVLAALGMSPTDLARSTVIETVLTAVVVAVVAVFCAQLTLVCFGWASSIVTGLHIPYRISPTTIAFAAIVTTLIATIGAVVPAWRTARTNVMDALRTA